MRASSRPTFPARYWVATDDLCEHPHTMRIDVVPFPAGDEIPARHAWRISCAARRARTPDLPTLPWHTFFEGLRQPVPTERAECALAHLGGVPAGYARLAMPLRDNLDNATLDLFVDPAHRRHGAGRALHAWAADRMRGAGRKRLTSETVQTATGEGDAFAAAMGATAALAETRSRLDLAAADPAVAGLDALLADAWTHAGGYRFVGWTGMPPDRWIDDVAYLDGRLLADAPMGDLDWEPEQVDADRVREAEERRDRLGWQRISGGMEHVASGRLVAFTTLAGQPDAPEHLWQDITLVDPPHRGHRLGLVVKLENLRQARRHRPGLRVIDTFNASSNTHMLAVNRAMGFRPVDRWMQWQQTV